MANLSTTAEGMHSAEQRLQQTLTTTNTHMNSVRAELAYLRSTWQGTASAQFSSSMEGWEQQCNLIMRKLGEMVQLMQGNRKTITSGEDNNMNIASGMNVTAGLPGF
jgi:WXG100 family type VII secretion target